MNHYRGLTVLALLVALSIAAPPAQRPPNFIIVYADDLGYADIGPFSTRKGARVLTRPTSIAWPPKACA